MLNCSTSSNGNRSIVQANEKSLERTRPDFPETSIPEKMRSS